jgi:hypothetical protein
MVCCNGFEWHLIAHSATVQDFHRDAGLLKKAFEDDWDIFETSVGDIPVNGAFVTTEALCEYWWSPKAIIPEDIVLTELPGVAPYMKLSRISFFGTVSSSCGPTSRITNTRSGSLRMRKLSSDRT